MDLITLLAHDAINWVNLLPFPGWNRIGIEVLGLIGVLGMTGWTFMSSRRHMLLAQVGGGIFYSLHYHFLGANTASIQCLLIPIGASLAMLRPTDHWKMWASKAYMGLIPALLVIVYVTWEGWWSALSGAGFLLAMFARSRPTALQMRIAYLPTSTCLFLYNMTVGSVVGQCSTLFQLFMNIRAVIKKYRKRASESRVEDSPAIGT